MNTTSVLGQQMPAAVHEAGGTECYTAHKHLNQKKYEQIIDAIQQKRAAAEKDGDAALVGLLVAAEQICLSCIHRQTEIARQQQFLAEATEREEALQQQLGTLLDLIANRSPAAENGRFRRGDLSPLQPPQSHHHKQAQPQSTTRWPPGQAFLHHPSLSSPPWPTPSSPAGMDMVNDVDQPGRTRPQKDEKEDTKKRPFLSIYCFGKFQVFEDDHLIDEWSNRKGKAIFKYLLTQRPDPVVKDRLMELFWPDSTPDAARNNLNVAIYSLRQTLRNGYPHFSHILYQEEHYLINPQIQLWTDVDAFTCSVQCARQLGEEGKTTQAVHTYHQAQTLYQGELFAEDRYEDWVLPERRRLHEMYIEVLTRLSDYYYASADYRACASICQKLLRAEPCREETHRQLMLAYWQQGHKHLALRQYHQCVSALQEELETEPLPETTQLYEKIRSQSGD